MLRRGDITISMLSNSTMLVGWCRPKRRLRRRRGVTVRLGNKRRGFSLGSRAAVQWGFMAGPIRMLRKIITKMAPNAQLIDVEEKGPIFVFDSGSSSKHFAESTLEELSSGFKSASFFVPFAEKYFDTGIFPSGFNYVWRKRCNKQIALLHHYLTVHHFHHYTTISSPPPPSSIITISPLL
ncbi:hypothetical protein L484_009443 [Morus notabilis]|uniref:Uncharacterized protein n=1 Tax=Morus notabilis TaxID=981085 RepID=W9RWN4_9ROSA|nr:hypothetical protein L484_009443 [Morus notabilis]